MDFGKIADDVYSLAASEDPLAPLVKEALDVIEQGLDTHGCVARPSVVIPVGNMT